MKNKLTKLFIQYISGNFDTTIGLKQEPQSYEKILCSLGKSSDQVLFLTDMIRGVVLKGDNVFSTQLFGFSKHDFDFSTLCLKHLLF